MDETIEQGFMLVAESAGEGGTKKLGSPQYFHSREKAILLAKNLAAQYYRSTYRIYECTHLVKVQETPVVEEISL